MATVESSSTRLPSKIILAVGTYDGVLAGWEMSNKNSKLQLSFATPVHGGSVRSLSIAGRTAAANDNDVPGSLLSCGYDEVLRTHDFHKRLTSSGEVRIPADFAFGTPVCSSFAPPGSLPTGPVATHCLLGFEGGKLVIYKKRDWTVQHVLAGHDGGVSSLAVHPSGKLALSAGTSDGKLKLWDLTKGRLAFVTKIPPASTAVAGRTRYNPVVSLVWSPDEGGSCYAFCHGSHVTVKDVATGKDLLDVELPSRVNQICLMLGDEGLFLAAACNDGSLPVLAVERVDDDVDDSTRERRAVLAIEPVDGPVAGEERFKCIQTVSGYLVVTANSAGVVSLVDLQGAVNMILNPNESESDDDEEKPVNSDSEGEEDSESEDEEQELAADIIDSVQLGSGARITCLAAWSYLGEEEEESEQESEAEEEEEEAEEDLVARRKEVRAYERVDDKKRKHDGKEEVTLDPEALERARALVADAKKIQKRKERKRGKKN